MLLFQFFQPELKKDILKSNLSSPFSKKGIFSSFSSFSSLSSRSGHPEGESNFDVLVGAYDGAEVCELIGIFMLSLLSKHINKYHIGLYRDDGLAILKNTSGPEVEKLMKKLQKLFKEKDLDIIIQCNLKITNYLDITLNLNYGSYRPYRKPNEETNYIHINSDHPPSIIKEISRSIEKKALNFVII